MPTIGRALRDALRPPDHLSLGRRRSNGSKSRETSRRRRSSAKSDSEPGSSTHAQKDINSSSYPQEQEKEDDLTSDSDSDLDDMRIDHDDAQSIIGGSIHQVHNAHATRRNSTPASLTEVSNENRINEFSESKARLPSSSPPLADSGLRRAHTTAIRYFLPSRKVDDESNTSESPSESASSPDTTIESNENGGNNGNVFFSFSLPFNIAPISPQLPKLRDILPGSNNNNHMGNHSGPGGFAGLSKKAFTLPVLRHEHKTETLDIRPAQLKRQSTDDSLNFNDPRYSHVHQMDNARLRAVKETLMTSISMDSLFSAKDDFPDLDGDVLIMGGYRGSILRDAHTGRRVWIPIKVGLNIRKINLEIGLSDEDEANVEQNIVPSGMLTHIGPVDVARKLIRRMEACDGCSVHEFGYDWRISLWIVVDQLLDKLRGLKEKHGKEWPGAIVIAHSMGGLIAHAAMQKRPDLFRGLVYVGSPWKCVNILGPIRNGDSVMLSSSVLAAQVNFTMRSSFAFLPLDGRCFVDKRPQHEGREMKMDFFDCRTWVKYGLSPCVGGHIGPFEDDEDGWTAEENNRENTENKAERNEQSKEVAELGLETADAPVMDFLEPSMSASSDNGTPGSTHMNRRRSSSGDSPSTLPFNDAVEYLDRILRRTKKFKESLLEVPSNGEYPPLAVVYGRGVPTVIGDRVSGPQDIVNGEFEDFIFGPGDGVVPARTLMPPGEFKVVGRFESERGHVGLMGDMAAMGRALKAILEEEAVRKQKGQGEG
ncbi:uncharacterized protein V1516DRAFT_667722 [Lipomyces oligophaga]|uniref:uncharacterized protein n=1 Tax=Lipomyces oligophaga TaxID=45792 RepID=UPI0034CDE706